MVGYQQMSIFDIIQENVFDPIVAYAKWGSGTQGWNERIKKFFEKNKDKKGKVNFLKDEYGIGGFGSPTKKPCYIHSIDHDAKGNKIRYYDENMNDVELNISYSELAEQIDKLIAKNEY